MKKLIISDLLSLEEYDKSREEIKQNLLLHKKNRSVKVAARAKVPADISIETPKTRVKSFKYRGLDGASSICCCPSALTSTVSSPHRPMVEPMRIMVKATS